MADRSTLINRLYYQELGEINPDQAGLDYWNGRTDLDEAGLRAQIRGARLGPAAGPSVVAPLMADQDYGAFLRKMQFDESSIQSSLQAAQEAARRRIAGQAGQYDTQRIQAERGVNNSFESRGMSRSGGRLKQQSETRTAIDLGQRQFEDQVYEGSAAAEREAATRIADMRRERAEQELNARTRLTQGSVV